MTQTRIVVTGAGGFLGTKVVQRLGRMHMPMLLIDRLPLAHTPPCAEVHCGDLNDDATFNRIQDFRPTVVLHLAGMLGGAAAQQPELAYAVNVEASIRLLSCVQPDTRFIFASSIAVFGNEMPPIVCDSTTPQPTMLYGRHKLLVEQALYDASAARRVQGLALRLPGIVANPSANTNLQSAFLHALFYKIRAGEPLVLPVPASGTTWLLSCDAAADAFIHAIGLENFPSGAVLTLPALRVQFSDLVAAVEESCGLNGSVTYAPDPLLTAQFGSYPPLVTTQADALGFQHDGTLEALVQRAWL